MIREACCDMVILTMFLNSHHWREANAALVPETLMGWKPMSQDLQLASKGAVEHGLEKVVQAATARRLLSLQSPDFSDAGIELALFR